MMGNNAIKNALVKYLGEEKHLENNNLNDLKSEVDIIKSLRDKVDDNIIRRKRNICFK